ncbi:N-acetylglutaminylglutamine amidotransferase [Azospirillum picis]|uniref:asparagine synthase (glutamine-hydrolyzing) n=1 Tax=Azospirillum picis TaxID=488438 RepID=A0ABU0MHB9_9PROT|nr:N-acetylglutaminylglutamine amidotransferase [Azospirillum picis]MBP2298954.1 asparagine synthase (glutamine-hydrolyzing) [Azospirillum picis]MDQ0532804.1 asparagine synthase (glutamine-hydrolyzing) [Azospirillum picis]
MCGLSGEIQFKTGHAANVAAVQAMCDRMAARGPDGHGLFAHGRVAFGHRRLKIIDLSEASQQPMVDADLGLTIVFNGCIYNHRDLRQELAGLGYRFFSEGDTEVLLKAYHAWGRDFVKRLNGMFAFAIHERDSGRVVLGRDRLGIKPLYLAEVPGALRFASSLPALVASGGIDTDVDPVALHHYMSFHAVVPAPYTILKGVRKLPPATILTVEPDGSRQESTYWSLTFGPQAGDEGRSFADWRDLVLEKLTLAVRRRLVADVPVGVLLSGGLDSSLITALLAENGQSGLKTFSIGFETVGDERGDEFQYSDIVAERFGTDHHRLFVDSGRALPELANCVRAMSEPMVSHDNIGFFLLSQEVAKHVKVVQSGQGADEVFGGYHWYPPLLQSGDALADYARVFFDRDHAEMAEALDPRLVGDDHSRHWLEGRFAQPGAERAVDKALRLDTTVMLVDDPVKRVDNMTMAAGLEARVPFLDHELVELAARIPAEMKVAEGGKYVLKEAARSVVPAEVIDRPKGYFPVPALKYLRGPFLDLVQDVLSAPAARERGLFRPDYLGRLLANPDQHITPLRGSKLWQAALLEFWFQEQGL